MKKKFYAIVIVTLLSHCCIYAQNKKIPGGAAYPTPKASISVLGGYILRDEVTFSGNYGYVDASGQYGAVFEYFVRPTHAISLSYSRMDTHAPIYLYSGVGGQLNEGTDAISVNYILVGGTSYVPTPSPILRPYGGFGLGMAIISGKDAGSSYSKFAWDAKLGVKIKAGQSLGIKIQTQLQSIAQGVGGGLYLGTGGTGLGVSTYSSVYQLGFSGGLVYDLK